MSKLSMAVTSPRKYFSPLIDRVWMIRSTTYGLNIIRAKRRNLAKSSLRQLFVSKLDFKIYIFREFNKKKSSRKFKFTWPYSLDPQVYTLPSLDKIMEWEFPASMAFIKAPESVIDKSDTILGHETSTSGIPPSPSWPFSHWPQLYIVLEFSSR